MTLCFLNIGSSEMVMLLFVAPVMAIGIYALYQCITNPQLTTTQRIVWLIIILSVPLFGCVGYLLANKTNKNNGAVRK
ncbi:PLDc N-terminal domain-containing protein [Olivibacter jilunii]|uniref:PLDc N-terminal domain-containing protein n=1 Tax=Olivibacter jilunii TaxID=985016 RepID=UPI0010311F44|nr:PLDc N-terminal domain-containing protein [Olivibacter jilunii]